MFWPIVSAISVGLLALVACRSSERSASTDAGQTRDGNPAASTDELPAEEVSRDDLYREQQRAESGERVGEKLRAPEVFLDAASVRVGAIIVAPRSAVNEKKAQRIDALHTHLRGLRDHWRMIHPGQAFVPAPHITIEPSASANAAASVLFTLAVAGFDGEATISSAGVEIRSRLRTASALRTPDAGGDSGKSASLLLVAAGQATTLQTHYLSERARCGPAIAGKDVASGIERLCSGMRCAALYVSGPGAFREIARDIAASSAKHPEIGLAFAPDPCFVPKAATTPNRSRSNGSTSQRGDSLVRRGRVTVSHGIDPEAAASVLDALIPAAHDCYAKGKKKIPNLEGRVMVKLVVDASGAVASARNDGSDLPDSDVIRCMLESTLDLLFPAPERGGAVVVCPWMLSP